MVKKYTDQQLKSMFIVAVTEYVAKHIAQEENTSYEQARKKFKNSKTYAYLTSDTPFPDEGPDYFLDWYHNEQKYGRMVSSTQLYFERRFPEEYRQAGLIK